MARKRKLYSAELIGLRGNVKGINFLIKDLKNSEVIPMTTLLRNIRDDMRTMIRPWSFSGTLINSLVISKPRKTPDGFRTSLRSTAPYASALERGVKPHYVYAGQGSKMYNWLQQKRPNWDYKTHKGAWFYVGGDGVITRHTIRGDKQISTDVSTYIKSRQSKRQFFGPVVRKAVSDDMFKKFGIKGVKNAVNNFSRRTANAKDRTVFEIS